MVRRSTRQRAVVLETLKELYHPTADDVVTAVRARDPSIGRATVFRNLFVLCEEGTVIRVLLPGEPTRYDAHPVPHDHFICRGCGRILDLPIAEPTPFPFLPGLAFETRSTTFTGLCADCRRKEQEVAAPDDQAPSGCP